MQYKDIDIRAASRLAEQVNLRTLENQKILEKPLNWLGTQSSAQSSHRKIFFATNDQTLPKSRYQSILILPNFSSFFSFVKTFYKGLQLVSKSSQVQGSQANEKLTKTLHSTVAYIGRCQTSKMPIFSQKTPSQMSDSVLNTPLLFCRRVMENINHYK